MFWLIHQSTVGVLIAQRLVEPTSFPKQLSCLVQEFDGMNFLEESDVVAQVGEERILGEFGVLDFFVSAERPKAVERFWTSARRINAKAIMANESACFGEKVCGGFVERVAAATASIQVEIVAPHVASV